MNVAIEATPTLNTYLSTYTVNLLLSEGRCDGISGRYTDIKLSSEGTGFRAAVHEGFDAMGRDGRRGNGGVNLVFTGEGFCAGVVAGGRVIGSGGLLSLHIISIESRNTSSEWLNLLLPSWHVLL